MKYNTKDRSKLTKVGKVHFCAADVVSVGRPTKGLDVSLPYQVPCHAVHLAACPSVGDVQSLLGLVLGCHAEVGTS